MKQILAVLAIGILAMTGRAHAAGSSDAPEAKDLAEMVQARDMIKGEHYNQAIPLLNKVIAQQPKNADALNLLAYSQRKTDDIQASLANYKKALAIDPSHKDAHEYSVSFICVWATSPMPKSIWSASTAFVFRDASSLMN